MKSAAALSAPSTFQHPQPPCWCPAPWPLTSPQNLEISGVAGHWQLSNLLPLQRTPNEYWFRFGQLVGFYLILALAYCQYLYLSLAFVVARKLQSIIFILTAHDEGANRREGPQALKYLGKRELGIRPGIGTSLWPPMGVCRIQKFHTISQLFVFALECSSNVIAEWMFFWLTLTIPSLIKTKPEFRINIFCSRLIPDYKQCLRAKSKRQINHNGQ